jgi:hypothetical protein
VFAKPPREKGTMSSHDDQQQRDDESEIIRLGAHIGDLAAKAVGEQLRQLPPERHGPREVRATAAWAFYLLLRSSMIDLLQNDPDATWAREFCAAFPAALEAVVHPSTSRTVN